jgi:hypothetical protein
LTDFEDIVYMMGGLNDNIIHDFEVMYNDIGLMTFVSIFCTPNMNFEARYVKQEYKELGISVLVCHKLYSFLQDCVAKFL